MDVSGRLLSPSSSRASGGEGNLKEEFASFHKLGEACTTWEEGEKEKGRY